MKSRNMYRVFFNFFKKNKTLLVPKRPSIIFLRFLSKYNKEIFVHHVVGIKLNLFEVSNANKCSLSFKLGDSFKIIYLSYLLGLIGEDYFSICDSLKSILPSQETQPQPLELNICSGMSSFFMREDCSSLYI